MVDRLHPRSRPGGARDPIQYRALLYFRQSVIARWLGSGNVVFPCQRFHVPQAHDVGVKVTGSKARYTNLQHCKRLWLCPVCASWHARTRRKQMERAIAAMVRKGYALAFVTYTVQHDAGNSLADEIAVVNTAHAAMHSGKAWQSIERDFEWGGSIKACEVTYGAFSWHWHLHEIGFVADDRPIEELQERLGSRWRQSLLRVGRDASAEHGLVVKRADSAARDYVGKWGIVPELASASAKTGKLGGVLPFQLADGLLVGKWTERWACDKFNEYGQATMGVKQLWASPSVRPFMAEPKQTADGLGIVDGQLLSVSLEQWRTIWQHGLRVAALRAAEDSTLNKFLQKLDTL